MHTGYGLLHVSNYGGGSFTSYKIDENSGEIKGMVLVNITSVIKFLQRLDKISCTVKLGDKEPFDKEQIGVKEPFPVINCQFTS